MAADSEVILNPGAAGAHIATSLVAGKEYQEIKVVVGGAGVATEVSAADPFPVSVIGTPALAADAATQTTLELIRVLLAAGINVSVTNGGAITISGNVTANAGTNLNTSALALETGGNLATIAGKDFATQTTLAALLAKVIAAPSTESKQDALNALVTTLNSMVATSALQTTGNNALVSILAQLVAGIGVTGTFWQATQPVSAASLPLPTGASTEATQLLVKAKTDNLDIAISALRDALRGTGSKTLADIVSALGSPFQAGGAIANTTFAATQSTAASLNMTEASAAAILAVQGAIADAIVAAGATGSVSAKLRRATQGLEDLKSLIVLAAGSNIIGKIGIDQTTPGTTNLIALTAETTKVIGTVNVSAGQTVANVTTVGTITNTVPTKETRSTTGTGSTASISASATVLASNANRLGATIYNESGGACRIKLGSTASATDYSYIIQIDGYYEVPFGFTGIITGIAVSGTAVLRVNELT